MGNSALGRGTAIEENKVKASSGDGSPDFLDNKVGSSMQVLSDQLEVIGGTAGEILTANGAGVAPTFQAAPASNFTQSALVSNNRDMSLATSTQAVTGVGFEPTFIYFVSCVSSGTGLEMSWGWASQLGASEHTLAQWYDGNTTGYNNSPGTNGIVIYIRFGAPTYWATLDSFDVDGFTLGWNRSSTPTGTIKSSIMCFR